MAEERDVVSTGSTDGAGSTVGAGSTDSTTKVEEKPDPVDNLVITRHTLKTRRGEIAYTARTGRVVLREEEVKEDVFRGWKARAEMSVTAYTLDGPEGRDDTTQPVTFVFNGGPG